MEYFSSNSFLLGMLLFGCLNLSNLLICGFCLLHNIRITEFGIFLNPGFSIHSKIVKGTRFVLGWLPLGSYVKPFGASTEDRKDTWSEFDLRHALFNKPRYLKILLPLTPALTYFMACIVAAYILHPHSFTNELNLLASYLVEAAKTMFGDKTAHDQFISTTWEIVSGRNTVLFAFALAMFILSSVTLLSTAVSSLLNHEGKIQGMRKWVAIIVMMAIYWMLLWKIPRFVSSFFTFSQNLIYLSSLTAGMLTMGLIGYFTTLHIARVNE